MPVNQSRAAQKAHHAQSKDKKAAKKKTAHTKTPRKSLRSAKADHRIDLFVHEYAIDLNATKAAKRAGFSAKSAHSQGSRLLKNVEVRDRIDEALAIRAEFSKLDSAEVIDGIRRTIRRCEMRGWNFQPFAVLKGYEMLGKHLKLFTDRPEESDGNALLNRLLEGRKRLQFSGILTVETMDAPQLPAITVSTLKDQLAKGGGN